MGEGVGVDIKNMKNMEKYKFLPLKIVLNLHNGLDYTSKYTVTISDLYVHNIPHNCSKQSYPRKSKKQKKNLLFCRQRSHVGALLNGFIAQESIHKFYIRYFFQKSNGKDQTYNLHRNHVICHIT